MTPQSNTIRELTTDELETVGGGGLVGEAGGLVSGLVGQAGGLVENVVGQAGGLVENLAGGLLGKL